MSTDTVEIRIDADGHAHVVDITVNFKPVVMPAHRATGLQIKQTAIAQGVAIQLDFVLFRDRGNGRRDPVRDSETIELTRGERFEAVPGDDNS
jgi:Multiubiquitin